MEEQKKSKIKSEELSKPNSFLEEIKPSKPTSLPDGSKLRKKPENLPK